MTGIPSARHAVAMPVDRSRELPHHLGMFGIAEVEAVHERARRGAHARKVARRLDHGELGSPVGIERAEARLAVGGRARARAWCRGGAARWRRRPGRPPCSGRAGGRTGGTPTTCRRSSATGEQRQQLLREVAAGREALAELVGGILRARRRRAGRRRERARRRPGRRPARRPARRRWEAGPTTPPAACPNAHRRVVATRRRRVHPRYTDRVEPTVVHTEARGVGDPPDDRRR